MFKCLSMLQTQKGCSSSRKRACRQADGTTRWPDSFSRIVKQLVGFKGKFDFWLGLAESLWKTKDKLILSGGTPEDASKYTKALNYTLDNLIVAAIPEYTAGTVHNLYDYNPYIPSTVARTGPQEEELRILKLLDLMVLTRRIQNSGRLITLVSQSQGNLADRYKNLIKPLVPKLKARYQQYGGSYFPVLDGFLRAFAERLLQDLLGTPSKLPDSIVVRKLACDCEDCTGVNRFLRSSDMTETFWAVQKKRSHMEDSLRTTLSDAVVFVTVKGRSPNGLKVTKKHEPFVMERWDGRVKSARAFLALVGTPEELARIMGKRYQDVQAALAGTKPYKISDPTPIVVPVKNTLVASTSAVQATTSGTQVGPVVAGVKRKAEDDGDVVDLT